MIYDNHHTNCTRIYLPFHYPRNCYVLCNQKQSYNSIFYIHYSLSDNCKANTRCELVQICIRTILYYNNRMYGKSFIVIYENYFMNSNKCFSIYVTLIWGSVLPHIPHESGKYITLASKLSHFRQNYHTNIAKIDVQHNTSFIKDF